MTEPTDTSFTGKTGGPPLLRIGVVVGAFAVLLASAAMTLGAPASPTGGTSASSSGGSAAGTGTQETADAWQAPAGFGFGDRGFGRGGFGHGFGQITITSIDGSSLALRTVDGWTRTITVTDATTITKGGADIELSALAVGDRIVFRQTQNADGTFTINAIEVVVPRVAGTVTAVSGNTVTIQGRDGLTWTITLTDSTTYRLGSGAGSRSDLTVGDEILVAGAQGTGNALTATTVVIRVPHIAGQVTAKSGNTLTIQRRDGTSITVNVDADTTYQVPGVENATLENITVGMVVAIEGTQTSDGSIDATAVLGGGRFGRGLHGGHRGPFAPFETPASPAPEGDTGGTS